MLRAIVIMTAVSAILAWCPRAQAQDFGEQGTVTLSVERAFGVHWLHTSIENGAPPPAAFRRSSDLTVFGLGWYRSETAYHNPRLGVDVFVIDHLSLGGSFGVYVWGADGDRQGVLFQPRIGYGFSLAKSVLFWPRGGFTYFSEEDAGGGANYNQFALSGEAAFGFLPNSNWAILVAPTVDIGVTGEVGNNDFTQHSVGVAFGLMGII